MAEKKVVPIKDSEPNEVVPFGELTARVADTFAIEPAELFRMLKAELFPSGAASDSQMFLVLQIIDKYQLNPFMHEIYAAVSQKTGKLLVGVQYDGFNTIAHRNKHYRGFKLERELDKEGNVQAIICKVYRDDWEHPGEFYAAMKEWFVKGKDTWEQRPIHQLGVKAFNNCVKLTLGLSGLYDSDDIGRITAAEDSQPERTAIETSSRKVEERTATPVAPATSASPLSAVSASEAAPQGAEQAIAEAREFPRDPDLPSKSVRQDEHGNRVDVISDNGSLSIRTRLAQFVEQRGVQTRLKLLLGKEGVGSPDELSEEQCERLLQQLEKRGK